jgi:hypothetical protein
MALLNPGAFISIDPGKLPRNVRNKYARLFKLREFHRRLFQKGDIRIGVLPQA